jgi:hypothetical protein
MHAIAPIGVLADTYRHAVDKLEAVVRSYDAEAPDLVRTAIIQILGEDLNVWPDDCLIELEALKPRLAA